MKRVLIFALLSLPLYAQNVWVTNFETPENPICEANSGTCRWLNGATDGLDWTDVSTTSGFAKSTQSGSSSPFVNDSTAILKGTWGQNQQVVIKAKKPSVTNAGVSEVEIRLRSTMTAHSSTGYEIDFTLGGLAVVRWNGPLNNFTQIGTANFNWAAVAQATPVLMATISGAANSALITVFNCSALPCTQLLQLTDTGANFSGNPGFGIDWGNTASNPNDFGVTQFVATDGTIRNAATCNSSDVQTQLTAVTADADVVIAPAGTCTWTSLTYTGTHSLTLMGQSTIVGTCAPGGSCTATNNTVVTVTAGSVSLSPPLTKSIRMTGFTLSMTGTASFGAMNFNASSTAAWPPTARIRIDHNHITDNINGEHTLHANNAIGMVDHNLFDGSSNTNTIQKLDNTPDGRGDASWNNPDNFGTGNFLFLENNNFNRVGGTAIDCTSGGRLVFRFNFTGTGDDGLQTHGTGAGDTNLRGCRAIEIYGNTFQFAPLPAGNTNFTFMMMLEGGTGLEYNNTLNNFCSQVNPDNVRDNNLTYTQSATPTGLGYCSATAIGGVPGPSNWDQNLGGQNGYACMDGIGRGRGDLLTGNNPTKVNSVTGTISWPRQDLTPWYIWNNTLTASPSACGSNYHPGWSSSDPNTAANRDFFDAVGASCTSGGSCTTGTGSGATLPTTCTTNATSDFQGNHPGVGFFNTTNNTLYRCTATNTWTPYYTAYAYPHPLDSLGFAATPNPAPSLSLTPSPFSFGNQAVGVPSSPQVFTLTNNGTANGTLSSITLSGANAGDFSQTNTCGTLPVTFAVGANCTITVRFTPSVAGSRTATLTATDTPDSLTAVSNLSGTGTNSSCPQNQTVGPYTLCGENYNDVASGASVTTTYSPVAGNGVIAWATWCYNSSCNSSTPGVTATIGDNINATESCFTLSPNSPFITNANGQAAPSGDFQEHFVWYCPSIPAGVTSFTVTPSIGTLSFLQLHVSEWLSGSLASSCSPVSACFESVDNLGVAGNTTGGLTATISTNGSTVSSNDLVFAATEIPFTPTQAAGFTISAGTGYTGITVSPAVTPGLVAEAKSVTSLGIQTATSTWNCTTPSQCTTPWFGVIAPIKAFSSSTVSLSPSSINFSPNVVGNVGPGDAITLTNNGGTTVTITSIAISGTNSLDFSQSNNCGSSLNAGASCNITIVFDATGLGARSASLVVTDSAAGSPQTVNLSGTGTAASIMKGITFQGVEVQ